MDFDRAYRQENAFFGTEPDKLLVEFSALIPSAQPVLDIGVGQGRNALFLAAKGFEVHGIDPSREAIGTVQRIAANRNLPIDGQQITFEKYHPPVPEFGTILAFGLIPLLSHDEIQILLDRLYAWTASDGLVFVTAFTTRDETYENSLRARNVQKNTPNAGVSRFTHLEPGELAALFGDWILVHSWGGFGHEHRHGEGPLERHAMSELIAQKPKSNDNS